MRTIYIDTTSTEKIIVKLTIDEESFVEQHPLDYHKAQIVLPLIEKLLEKEKLTLHDLDAIEVNPGPGSFTGIRVGISIANALGFALNILVNGTKQASPAYS